MKDLNWILAFMAVVLIVLSPYLLEEITVRQNVQAWKEGRAWVANFVANWPDITADNFNIEFTTEDDPNKFPWDNSSGYGSLEFGTSDDCYFYEEPNRIITIYIPDEFKGSLQVKFGDDEPVLIKPSEPNKIERNQK